MGGDVSPWEVNFCGTEILEDQAILPINSRWSFETSRIKVLGTLYYELMDWNFICFCCRTLNCTD